MKKFLVIFICLVFVLPLMAAKKEVKVAEPPSELVIPEKDCENFLSYQPAAGVEYEPGVDVHGKPVMEADITPSVVKPPEKYSFDITVDVARYIGLPLSQRGVQDYATIGTIKLEKGKATFNGAPLEGDAEAALKAICAAQKEKKEAAKVIDQK